MFQRPALAENAQEFQRIMQIPCSSPTASANYAKFAPFVNPLYIMFQMPDQWQKNSLKFQRIKRNLLDSPTHPVNYANSAHFALKLIHI